MDEEEYLLKSVSKLVARFNITQGALRIPQHTILPEANSCRATRRLSSAADSTSLLPHLLQFTDEHRTEAASLQTELQAFAVELSEALEEIWKKAPEAEEGGEGTVPAPGGWAARMEAHEKRRHANPVDSIAKPDLAKQEWKLKLPDARPGP